MRGDLRFGGNIPKRHQQQAGDAHQSEENEIWKLSPLRKHADRGSVCFAGIPLGALSLDCYRPAQSSLS